MIEGGRGLYQRGVGVNLIPTSRKGWGSGTKSSFFIHIKFLNFGKIKIAPLAWILLDIFSLTLSLE